MDTKEIADIKKSIDNIILYMDNKDKEINELVDTLSLREKEFAQELKHKNKRIEILEEFLTKQRIKMDTLLNMIISQNRDIEDLKKEVHHLKQKTYAHELNTDAIFETLSEKIDNII